MNQISVHTIRTGLAAVVAALIIAFVVEGCSSCSRRGDSSGKQPAVSHLEELTEGLAVASKADRRVVFRTAGGEGRLVFRFGQNHATLKGNGGKLIGQYDRQGQTLVVKGGSGEVLAHVVGKPKKVEVRGPGKTQLRFSLRREGGGVAFNDAQGNLLLRGKKRKYGYLVLDAAGQRRFHVKIKPNRTVLRYFEGETVYVTRDKVDALAVACLGINELSLAERGGLFARLQLAGGL